MRNVTISVDDEVAKWARLEAARRDTSVSRFVGEMLAEKMRSTESYERARRMFFSVAPSPLRADGEPMPSREDLHERADLR